jgi:Sterol methyltransferase C-terminal
MLVRVANSLVDGGETGVFSPMHLLLFRKPLEDEVSHRSLFDLRVTDDACPN